MNISFDWNTLVGKKLCYTCRFWSGEMIDGWKMKDGMLVARRICMNPFRIGILRSSHHLACAFYRCRKILESPCVTTKDENGEIVTYKIIKV